ncbi:ABC transporter substrate-binding protein [uncultured Umboniibacter sp.]|uniref:MlaC/ttg2D family ABC transporter substrate-binding protein n=1 Tax=uncultured Umboniibacter sp. TaxID=1798917 RepID=UPI00260E2175|nr:ABC transporter substrate-binding protein [uncultured Umboniibacter sp.]
MKYLQIALLTLCSLQVNTAISENLPADEAVAKMTNEVIEVVMEAKENGNDLDGFMPRLDELMTYYADFDWIAAQIMGRYRQSASPEQISRFGTRFRSVMISTYAKSFLAYNGERVTTLPVEERYAGERRVPVRQTVEGIAGGLNVIYTMGQRSDGRWVMLNLRVNGVNLGQTYNQQFARMMTELNSIDAVIDNWGQ